MGTRKGRETESVSFLMLALCAGIFLCICLMLSACGGRSTPVATFSPIPSVPLLLPTNTLVPIIPVPFTPTPVCLNGLTFISDATIPDLSIVAAGSLLDKQWLVQNSGSCNWDSRYRLRLVNSEGLGAPPEQALYPARAGTQALLRIVFTAPATPGEYMSEWQAYDPQGIPFGETFYINIIVQ